MDMVKINSPAGQEGEMARYIMENLQALGLNPKEDEAASSFDGDTGNIIAHCSYPGISHPTILLTAHMDRVEPGEDIEPYLEEDRFQSRGDTILAADDVSGIAAILEAITVLKEDNQPHYPVILLFTAAEEVGLLGSKAVQKEDIEEASFGYALDSDGPVGKVVIQSPSHNSLRVQVQGKASHAGISPEEGINAIKVASLAISSLTLGQVDEDTTANIGVIKGGEAMNIVPPEVTMEGEIRSFSPQRLEECTRSMENTFQTIAQNHGAQVTFESETLYSAFTLQKEDQVVNHYLQAMARLGWQARVESSKGGSDASILNVKGVPTAVVSTGMEKAHSTDEYLPREELKRLTRLLVELLRIPGGE